MNNTHTKPKIYFISGLGADERAFQFLDLSFCTPVFIGWIIPLKNESLKDYAIRLMAAITEAEPNVVGLSFGGMLASEIALAKPKAKVVLISSNKTRSEFPPYFRLGKYLPLYRIVPKNIIQMPGGLFSWMMSAEGKAQKEVQLTLARETDIPFTKWAIESILNWKNTSTPENVVHIHGENDRLLPYKYVKADHAITGGKHLMVMDKAAEVSVLLRQCFVENI